MKDAFWGQIFGLLSAGGATIETIRQYIESQGENGDVSAVYGDSALFFK